MLYAPQTLNIALYVAIVQQTGIWCAYMGKIIFLEHPSKIVAAVGLHGDRDATRVCV